jgi:hypothetical protein
VVVGIAAVGIAAVGIMTCTRWRALGMADPEDGDPWGPGPDLGGAKGANAPGPPDSKGPPAACSSVLLHEIINNRTVLDWIMTACTSNLE